MPNLPWVEAIKARVAKATPGPWEFGTVQGDTAVWTMGEGVAGGTICDVNFDHQTGDHQPHADADLIANAPTDLSYLLRAVEVLGEAVETACGIIELGDQRLLAGDGPVGALPPDITLAEWRKMYRALNGARRALADVREG